MSWLMWRKQGPERVGHIPVSQKLQHRQGWAILEGERVFPIYSCFLFEKLICMDLLCILKAIYWSRLCICSSISNEARANWSPREALQQNRLQKISQGLREQEKRESNETKSLFSSAEEWWGLIACCWWGREEMGASVPINKLTPACGIWSAFISRSFYLFVSSAGWKHNYCLNMS